VPHRGDELPHADVAPVLLRSLFALLDAGLYGLHGLFERQSARQVLLRGPPDLAVDNAVCCEILDELSRDPSQSVGSLHHRGGQVERLEVLHERPRIALLGEPPGERLGVRLGQLQSDRIAELDDGLRPHAAVEVVVQRHLGEGPDRDALQVGVAVLIDRHVGSPQRRVFAGAVRVLVVGWVGAFMGGCRGLIA
jgi:hypothetical protein